MGVLHLVSDDTVPNEYPARDQLLTEPTIEPGQIWLVECAAGPLPEFHAALLRLANVVLYERALGAAVAGSLPIGAYAEPLPPTNATETMIAPRARQFAAEGWSVLLLVKQRPGWRQLLRSVTDDLSRSGSGSSPLLAIGTLGSDELLSLTLAPPGHGRPMPGQAFTANGLAG